MSAPTDITPSPTSTVAPRWLQRIFYVNLFVQAGIVVTGGVVRLTGSGLGCPTWPECAPGSIFPTEMQSETWHKYVEFGNRLLTFVLAIAAIAAIVGALVWNSRLKKSGHSRRPIVILAAIPLIGTFAQAILGGVTVLTGLNPISVSGHFLLSAVIIAFVMVLVWRAKEPGDQPITRLASRPVTVLSYLLVANGFVVLTLGTIVTGSGPHAGDEAADRLPFNMEQVAWAHADSVFLFIGMMIGMLAVLYATHGPRRAVRATWWLISVSLAQGLIGYVQYFTNLPWVLVAFHLIGATLVWIAVIRVPLALRTRGESPAVPDDAPSTPVVHQPV